MTCAFFFLCREVGCISWDILWLLFCSRLFGAVCALLGAQCERVGPSLEHKLAWQLHLMDVHVVSQGYLRVDTVYQQESSCICCIGSSLLPDTRGANSYIHVHSDSLLLFRSHTHTDTDHPLRMVWSWAWNLCFSICLQILDAMNQDSGIPLTQLQVDGGMTSNRLLMQLQADILCIPVGRPSFCPLCFQRHFVDDNRLCCIHVFFFPAEIF